MVVRYTPSMSESTSTYTHISYESANANKSHKIRWRSNFYRMISLHLVYSFIVILRIAIIKPQEKQPFRVIGCLNLCTAEMRRSCIVVHCVFEIEKRCQHDPIEQNYQILYHFILTFIGCSFSHVSKNCIR